MDRRDALRVMLSAPVLVRCKSGGDSFEPAARAAVAEDVVLGTEPLGYQWPTRDPFLFCVHHDDAYPAGNAQLGPRASLEGRNIGSDFVVKDGFRMYHGDVVPGFPRHPHRGFETVTVVRRGLVDHSDSLGAAARYGKGDVQWLTAGNGIVHAEMFPLLDSGSSNPLELFQIWMNLPARDKLVAPHFSMLWSHTIGKQPIFDAAGKKSTVTVVAGKFASLSGPPPPPHSWAARAENQVAIWTVLMEPGARVALPAAPAGTNRTAYFFRGKDLRVGGHVVASGRAIDLRAEREAPLENGPEESEILVLQGRPIDEPVARHGPFVMNTPQEIEKAYADYRATLFGGWPWPKDDPVHAREERFARHADGHVEREG